MTFLCLSSISIPVLHAMRKKEMNLKAQFFYFLLHLEKQKPNKCPCQVGTGIPCYPKVKRSYETYPKLQWHKVKKQLASIYTKKILSIPRPLIGFSDTLWYILLMDAQNKSSCKQMLTATFENFGSWMPRWPSVVPGEGARRCRSCCSERARPLLLQRPCWALFSPFLCKSENPLWLSFS